MFQALDMPSFRKRILFSIISVFLYNLSYGWFKEKDSKQCIAEAWSDPCTYGEMVLHKSSVNYSTPFPFYNMGITVFTSKKELQVLKQWEEQCLKQHNRCVVINQPPCNLSSPPRNWHSKPGKHVHGKLQWTGLTNLITPPSSQN